MKKHEKMINLKEKGWVIVNLGKNYTAYHKDNKDEMLYGTFKSIYNQITNHDKTLERKPNSRRI